MKNHEFQLVISKQTLVSFFLAVPFLAVFVIGMVIDRPARSRPETATVPVHLRAVLDGPSPTWRPTLTSTPTRGLTRYPTRNLTVVRPYYTLTLPPPSRTPTVPRPTNTPTRAAQYHADLTIALHLSENPVPAGSPLTLTFKAVNQGTATAESTVMYITLPDGITFESATSTASTPCVHNGRYLTCELGDLAVRASQMVTVELLVPRSAYGIHTIFGSVDSPSISLPGGGKPAVTALLIVLPRSFFFLPQVRR